jgi:hypothetical protein
MVLTASLLLEWDNDLSEVLINGEYKKINGGASRNEKLVHRKINDLGRNSRLS